MPREYVFVFSLVFLTVVPINEGFIISWYHSLVNAVYNTGCKFMECCKDNWVEADFTNLETSLREKVYGQAIVNEIVMRALKDHLSSKRPKHKALALSFHGRPGIGKNYVAQFIQSSLFKRGSRSNFAHFFAGRIHFPLEKKADIYKIQLIDWIRGNVSRCEYSLFVFDEVDKMPQGVLDAVKAFIDYHPHIDGVDFRNSIFIFLSNTGGEKIAEQFLELWKSGKKRSEMRLADYEDLIRIGAFNERGGFHKSDVIESGLMDHYIPFLPLERDHVKACIIDEFRKRGFHRPDEGMVRSVLKDITFGPDSTPIFSNGGCKRIAQKVVTVIEKIRFEL